MQMLHPHSSSWNLSPVMPVSSQRARQDFYELHFRTHTFPVIMPSASFVVHICIFRYDEESTRKEVLFCSLDKLTSLWDTIGKMQLLQSCQKTKAEFSISDSLHCNVYARSLEIVTQIQKLGIILTLTSVLIIPFPAHTISLVENVIVTLCFRSISSKELLQIIAL